MEGVAFALSPNSRWSCLLTTQMKRKCNFLFIPAEFPPDDPLPHRANTNDSYGGVGRLSYIWFDLREALTAETKDLYYSSALISC